MRGCMDRISRRNPRAARAAFGVLAVGAALALAACSSSSSTSSSAPASSAPASSATSASSAASSAAASGADISALTADVNKYTSTPSFSDYGPNYGGKIPSISNLAGKKIMIIPGVSALAACEEIAQAVSNFAKAAGMIPTIFNNTGTETNNAIEDAIHEGYAAISMG